MPRFDIGTPCEPGEHELVFDRRADMHRCQGCGLSAQTIVAHPRTAVKGDYRVVCRGAEGDGVCAIGPSVPTPTKEFAIDDYNAHQREAVERDGQPHDAEVIQF